MQLGGVSRALRTQTLWGGQAGNYALVGVARFLTTQSPVGVIRQQSREGTDRKLQTESFPKTAFCRVAWTAATAAAVQALLGALGSVLRVAETAAGHGLAWCTALLGGQKAPAWPLRVAERPDAIARLPLD